MLSCQLEETREESATRVAEMTETITQLQDSLSQLKEKLDTSEVYMLFTLSQMKASQL